MSFGDMRGTHGLKCFVPGTVSPLYPGPLANRVNLRQVGRILRHLVPDTSKLAGSSKRGLNTQNQLLLLVYNHA